MNRSTTISDKELERTDPSPDMTIAPSTTASPAKERVFLGTGLYWGLIVGMVLAVAVLILAAQNTGSITVTFMAWEFSTPLIVLILGVLLIGVVFDELFGLYYRTRRRRTQRDRDHLERLKQTQSPS